MTSRVEEADEAVSEDSSTSDSSESTKSFERYCRKKVELEQRRHRGSLRTRSASRERTLAKIKYCWRCHQTGHESYECSAELHPVSSSYETVTPSTSILTKLGIFLCDLCITCLATHYFIGCVVPTVFRVKSLGRCVLGNRQGGESNIELKRERR